MAPGYPGALRHAGQRGTTVAGARSGSHIPGALGAFIANPCIDKVIKGQGAGRFVPNQPCHKNDRARFAGLKLVAAVRGGVDLVHMHLNAGATSLPHARC